MSKLCIKAISQVDCNFLIAERKPENDSTGFKPVPARFFRALLKSKLLQRSFRCKYLKSQWDFRVKIGRLPEAREIMNDQVLVSVHYYTPMISAQIALHSVQLPSCICFTEWRENSRPIARRAKKRLTITDCYRHCHKIAIDYQQTDLKYFCLHLTYCNGDFFTLYTLTSVCIFSILSHIHPLRS